MPALPDILGGCGSARGDANAGACKARAGGATNVLLMVSSRPVRVMFDLVATLAVSAMLASTVHADSPEFFDDIALHPTDPNVFALHYASAQGGLVFSRDGGHSAQLLPGRAIHYYGLADRTPMLFVGDGKLLLALDSGLDVDDGRGCFPRATAEISHFSEPALRGLYVASVAAHPSDPDTAFLVTRAHEGAAHAGVWRRDKQGTLTPLGKSEPALSSLAQVPYAVKDLAVVARGASVDGLRFVQAGVAYDHGTMPPMVQAVLRVSDDLGETWTQHAVTPLNEDVGNPRILYVESSEPFGALIGLDNHSDEELPDTIFVTRDGARSFQPYLDKLLIAQRVLRLPSGQLLIADRGSPGGLWSAANLDAAPTQLGDQPVHCLAYQPSSQKIVMCRGYEVGYYEPSSNTFCAMFRMGEMSSLVECSGAPLIQNAVVMTQLCDKFCGAQHYATAPLCSTVPVAPGQICGPAAVVWQNSDPDPEKHWTTPPGNNAAPRCAGFSAPPDAGVADAGGTPDAGGSAASEAGVAGDAGAHDSDGGAPFVDAEIGQVADEEDAATDSEPDAPKRGTDGCGCRLAASTAGVGALRAWLAAAFVVLLAMRSRRRAARRP